MFIKSGLVFQNKNKIAEEKETFFFFKKIKTYYNNP